MKASPRTILRACRPIIARSPFLSALYRSLRDEWQFAVPPAPTPLGFRFGGHPGMASGTFEVVETAIVRQLLSLTGTLINIGANVGYYCCVALEAGKHVVAFEPLPANVRLLLRNIQVNGWSDSFECYPLALSDRTGVVELYGGGTAASLVEGWAGQQHSILAPVSTLDIALGDRFVQDAPLIVVDVEGSEHRLLQGARRLLAAERRPIWLMEISVAEHQPDGTALNPTLAQTFAEFQDHGYAALTATSSPRPVTMEEIDAIVGTGVDTLGTHNFLFVEHARRDAVLALIGS